jgi:Lrp/AsnC family leucine-responsive transcriptional regulator
LIYRINRLEKEGIISGYYVVPNIPKLGLVGYKVLLKYQNLSKENEEAMIKFLEEAKEVGWIVKTEGSYDLMFIVWTKNEITFDDFWTSFLNNYGRYFYEKEVLILIENHICRKEYLIEDKNKIVQEVFHRGEALNECNKIDSKIIYELSKNSRISVLELSRKIGLTPEGISYRIKQLLNKGIILTFRPKIDLEKIGYSYYNVLIRIKDFSIMPKLFSYARNNKNITYYVKYIGKYSVGLDIEIDSQQGFRKILEDIRALFGEYIINYDFVRIINEVKITYGVQSL